LQIPGLRWAKELGFHVILTDVNTKAPGRKYADQYENISGTDVTAMLKLANHVAEQYDLVGAYASSDFGLPAVAMVNETAKRSSPGIYQIDNALNKLLSREIWNRQNVSIPPGEVVHHLRELKSKIKKIGYPLIFKPVNSSGSQGVISVWNSEDISTAFDTARKFSDSVLVEQLMDGYHIDVNGLFIEGKFVPCGIMRRFFCDPPYHYPIWGCQPSLLDEKQEKNCYRLLEHAARVLSINEGPVKGDLIWTTDGLVILELSPRFHGDVITAYITPRAKGINPIKAYLTYLYGEENPYRCLEENRNKYAGWCALFPSSTGVLKRISGLEDALSSTGVFGGFISLKPGAVIKRHKDNSSVGGFLWAEGENVQLLESRLDRAKSRIRFETN